MNVKYLWMSLGILLLVYAFYILVFGITNPVFGPSLNTITDRASRAFISMALSAAIFTYLHYSK